MNLWAGGSIGAPENVRTIASTRWSRSRLAPYRTNLDRSRSPADAALEVGARIDPEIVGVRLTMVHGERGDVAAKNVGWRFVRRGLQSPRRTSTVTSF
jgi:hypothetical protein